jgi:Rrf2 family protein
MKFSTRTEYGLKAVVSLGRSFPKKKSMKEISLEEKIPAKYLEKLLGELRKNRIVKSLRGKDGGYVLSKKTDKIKVGEVVEILEGSIAPVKCIEGGCDTGCECSSSFVWSRLQEQIKKTLYGIKLSDLI